LGDEKPIGKSEDDEPDDEWTKSMEEKLFKALLVEFPDV